MKRTVTTIATAFVVLGFVLFIAGFVLNMITDEPRTDLPAWIVWSVPAVLTAAGLLVAAIGLAPRGDLRKRIAPMVHPQRAANNSLLASGLLTLSVAFAFVFCLLENSPAYIYVLPWALLLSIVTTGLILPRAQKWLPEGTLEEYEEREAAKKKTANEAAAKKAMKDAGVKEKYEL
ncbi:MAG: hypothetical protein ACOCX1_05925 [Fimbriimonadaceae bacterium]